MRLFDVESLPGEVRAISEVELDNVLFRVTDWYEYGRINNQINGRNMFIRLGNKHWPHNVVPMTEFTFKTLFITREEDRDIKIKKVIDEIQN